jgi:hypothetical protein
VTATFAITMSLLPISARTSAALVAVGDPNRDRTVYATIVLLVALGFTMIMLAVWLLRSTRPDPEVLAPLERMGQRKWRRADPVWQRRHLDEVRPGGADPLEPMSAPPATDAEFERGPQPIGFDDLAVSNETTAAAATALPAPAVGAAVLEGPVDGDAIVVAGDVPADESTADAPEAGDTVADETDETDDDTPADRDDSGDDVDDDVDEDQGDDDEDITDEQDTEDFLAVLDQVNEEDPEFDPEVEPDVEPEVAETEADLASDDVSETETDSVSDPDAGPSSDPNGEERDESG